MDKTKKNLTLFALTWPIFIELALHMLMGNADTLMLSQYSDSSVAAVGVSNQIISFVIMLFGFVATGASILIAQNLGANRDQVAGTIGVTSISMNLIFSIVLSLALYLSSTSILRLMGLPAVLMDEASNYIEIVGGFIFVQAVIMTISAILRSYGFTKDTMLVTIGMNILNVIGNYFVIFGPFGFPILGVEGVAYSTVISRFLGFVTLFIILVKRSKQSLPWQSFIKYNKKHVKNLLGIGIPAAGESLSHTASQMVITLLVTQLGVVAITTKVYVQNLMMFIYLFSIAISQGSQILIGHMIGAGEIDKAYKRAIKSLQVSVVITFMAGIIIYFSSDLLLGIFTNNMTIIEMGTILLLLTIILEPGRAFNLNLVFALRAAGDVRFPVYIGIASMWGISVAFSWFFGIYLEFGLIGVWIGFIADEWLRGIFMLRRWRSRVWVQKTFVKKEEAVS
ncbi:MATE family efflux transporter [Bacillus sp. FJAT-49711]|uniref:MATE family efflux transporter n=1 Tax=Bacillus sp. FJAT-49711 TaxID=2833585 RepID=UPI001BC8F918|nr:MATE family efflux transporter [Bacillus sp. FJAT-49711]MBS4220749.1 MATE family efflux transporter [Bacillus sp. FJAT-49711]